MYNCDYEDDVMAIIEAPKPMLAAVALCTYECHQDPDCTHFVWNPKTKGTCFLKAGRVPDPVPVGSSISVDDRIVCGFIERDDSQTQINAAVRSQVFLCHPLLAILFLVVLFE